MRHWLLKSEPAVFGFNDLVRVGREPWNGVRNYQARNFLREMRAGDLCLFYHSGARPTGVAGVARVAREAYPDDLQFGLGVLTSIPNPPPKPRAGAWWTWNPCSPSPGS